MSSVIKSHLTTGSVRALPIGEHQPRKRATPIDLERLRLEAEIVAVTEQLRAAEGEAHRKRAEAQAELRDAEERGFQAGLAAAASREEDRVAALTASARAAADAATSALTSLERLAPLLAAEGLRRIIGSDPASSELLQRVVLEAVRRVEAEAIVRLEVSAEDFPDLTDLRRAVQEATHLSIEVRYGPNLGRGDCVIRLGLGQVEVGLNQQWSRLEALYASLAEPECIHER